MCITYAGSHECDYPTCYSTLPTLTASKIKATTSADIDTQVREQLAAGKGLYSVDTALLTDLRPDVIVTQSLCKVCSVDYCLVEDIASHLHPRPRLVDTNPTSLEEVLRDVQRVADAMGLSTAGESAVARLQQRIDAAVAVASNALKKNNGGYKRPVVGFCEWTDPIFCGGHWTPQLIELAGGSHPLNPCTKNSSSNDGSSGIGGIGVGPSFTVSGEDFAAVDPDVIVIACCGFDIPTTVKEMTSLVTQPWWQGLKAVVNQQVWVVDGNQMFNRPGPRLVDALEWLVAVLHPEDGAAAALFPPDFPVVPWK